MKHGEISHVNDELQILARLLPQQGKCCSFALQAGGCSQRPRDTLHPLPWALRVSAAPPLQGPSLLLPVLPAGSPIQTPNWPRGQRPGPASSRYSSVCFLLCVSRGGDSGQGHRWTGPPSLSPLRFSLGTWAQDNRPNCVGARPTAFPGPTFVPRHPCHGRSWA